MGLLRVGFRQIASTQVSVVPLLIAECMIVRLVRPLTVVACFVCSNGVCKRHARGGGS